MRPTYADHSGKSLDPKLVYWEPGGTEERILEAVEHALTLDLHDVTRKWAWAERLFRLKRIAHGTQSAERALAVAGAKGPEAGPVIARYLAAAQEGARQYADDPWFTDHVEEARQLTR